MKTTMQSSVPGNTDKTEMTSTVIADGDFAYTPGSVNGRKNLSKWKSDAFTANTEHSGGMALFKLLHTYHELTLLPDETVDGSSAYVIQGRDKPAMPGSLTVKYYFSKDNGILIQSITSSPPPTPAYTAEFGDRSTSVTMKILNLKIDPALPPEHFHSRHRRASTSST